MARETKWGLGYPLTQRLYNVVTLTYFTLPYAFNCDNHLGAKVSIKVNKAFHHNCSPWLTHISVLFQPKQKVKIKGQTSSNNPSLSGKLQIMTHKTCERISLHLVKNLARPVSSKKNLIKQIQQFLHTFFYYFILTFDIFNYYLMSWYRLIQNVLIKKMLIYWLYTKPMDTCSIYHTPMINWNKHVVFKVYLEVNTFAEENDVDTHFKTKAVEWILLYWHNFPSSFQRHLVGHHWRKTGMWECTLASFPLPPSTALQP